MKKTWMNFPKIWIIILLGGLLNCQSEAPSIGPRPMQILFLGHDAEHHNSSEYAPYLSAALSRKGFQFTYAESPEVLNTEYLSQFDVLMLYANHDEIAPDQEKALLNFVKKGGGFVPVHCASYCFRNSDRIVNLIGGQFSSHDTATFTAKIVSPDHPAMQNVDEFSSWDETYVHSKLAKDIDILMERIEGDHREPYTWIKNYGKGRVFYTALGHDERTWKLPAFHNLLEQGLRWVLGEKKHLALQSLELPPLEYSEAKIPNYEERDPPPRLQTPLSPEASQKYIQVPPGFNLELFAAEPDLVNPIHMDWDEKGRLWVIETRDYPNQIKKELGQGSDKIKILEDTNGDGRADKFTVFADNLSVPTSLTFANGGIIVSQAPYFLFLKDTTGDDRADILEVIMEGWGISDTHAGPSNLQYGFDNKIWGVLGYSGFSGSVGAQRHEFKQGAYRFSSDGSELEFMGASSNNTWGLAFSEDFDVFLSTANNTHSAYLGIPHRFFQDVEGLKIKSIKKIDGHYHFHPNTSNVRQVDVFGGFTAAAGHSFYGARDFPSEYWNRVALVCEPTGHLLHRAIIKEEGAGYVEEDGWNLIAAADEWFSPVCAEVGPDGAVWILDWYNFIIQHNPTPPGFENGLGNAHINPLRDKEHGRIYRLTYDAAAHQKQAPLSTEDADGLLAALQTDNLRWRLHAQRMLVERGKVDIGPKLIDIIENSEADDLGLSVGAQHALWTLHGLGLANDENSEVLNTIYRALEHESAAVRKNAIRVLPKNITTLVRLQERDIFADPDDGVLLASILALTEMPAIASVGSRLYALSQSSRVREDEWLSRAVYTGAVKHRESFSKAMDAADRQRIAQGYEIEEEIIDWSDPSLAVNDWQPIFTPSRWSKTEATALHDFDGIIWTRRDFTLSNEWSDAGATLSLGPIDDSEEVYLNGKMIGSTRRNWFDPRVYKVPPGMLKAGENALVIRVTDGGGRGGLYGEEPDVFIRQGNKTENLSGIWKYKIEKQFFPNRSIFAEEVSVQDLFLLHYGPYAQELSQSQQNDETNVDREIIIKTLPDQMRYDPEGITVEVGEKVKFIFENNDGMQHNLLIGVPGSLEVIGEAADAMAQSSEGADQEYIPDLPQIILAAGLVDPGDTRNLIWQVPDEPGDYVFVCTFPGHWRTMKGIIQVRKSPSL